MDENETIETETEQSTEAAPAAGGGEPDLAEMAAAVAARKAEKAKARGLPPPKVKAPPAPAAKTAPAKGPDGKFQKRTPPAAVAPTAPADDEAPGETPTPEEKVPVGEWVKLRAQQREGKAKLEAERQSMLKELEGRTGRVKGLEDAFARWEAGDYDGFAKAMGELSPVKRDYKGWNDLAKELARRQQSPEYVEIQRLRKAEEERSAREKKDADDRKAAEEQRNRQALEREHVTSIAAELAASADPQEKAIAARPDLAHAVLNVQRHAWHNGERTLTAAEALREKMPDGKSILDRMQAEWQFLSTVFGNTSPSPPASQEPRKGRSPAPQNAEKTPKPTLSRGSVSDATGHGKPKDRKALIAKWAAQM